MIHSPSSPTTGDDETALAGLKLVALLLCFALGCIVLGGVVTYVVQGSAACTL